MIPVSEDYTPPLEHSSKVILVGLACSSNAQHDGHLGFVSGQADRKFFVTLLSDSRLPFVRAPSPVLHLAPHNLKLIHDGDGNGNFDTDTACVFSIGQPSRKKLHPTKRMRDKEPYFVPLTVATHLSPQWC